jgi:two-component system phosphate regulon sensor histidine kinase PhoR
MNIRTKLTILLLSLSVFVIAIAGFFTTLSVERSLRGRITDELNTEADQVEYALRHWLRSDTNAHGSLREYAAAGRYRLTLIERNGRVVYDTDVPREDIGGMENHANRPEVAEALRGGTGMSARHSVTVGRDFMYLARPFHPHLDPAGMFGTAYILRVSIPLTEIDAAAGEIRRNILLVSILVLGVVIVIVGLVSGRLARPLAVIAETAEKIIAGDLDRRIEVHSGDEIGRLGTTLNSMIETLNGDIVRLRKLERVRTEFLGNVSHELRTPIFAIQGMIETLINGAIDDPAVNRDFLQRALKNTRNLNALLNDLIEISRIESGDMKMSFRYFDLGDLVRQVIAEMSPMAETKTITLTPKLPSATIEVLGDRERLKQVLVNLVDNAIKYNREGGWVNVSWKDGTAGGVLSVEDGGIGIPVEHVGRIFERFYRADKERSREVGGTGLGLAIVKHIIEAHGTTVTVETTPGRGSAFRFILKKAQ